MIEVQSEMKKEGKRVTITQLSRWFDIPRRSLYYKPQKRKPKVDEAKVTKIKTMIEKYPSYGYRRLALLTGINKKAVQRILKLKGWQVRKRARV